MANKQGGLLATLGKRMLGFSTSSNACCGAPAAATDEVKASEAKRSEVKTVEVRTPETSAQDAACCAPSCCASAAPAEADAKS